MASWLLLLAAGIAEVVMAVALKYAEGWSRPVPGALGIAAGLVSIALLTSALKGLPLGTAYAVWTGLGALGVTAVGIAAWGESASPARLACIALVAAGIVGLKLSPP